jgi:hypothetical protein
MHTSFSRLTSASLSTITGGAPDGIITPDFCRELEGDAARLDQHAQNPNPQLMSNQGWANLAARTRAGAAQCWKLVGGKR